MNVRPKKFKVKYIKKEKSQHVVMCLLCLHFCGSLVAKSINLYKKILKKD